jgi:guanylate kinase
LNWEVSNRNLEPKLRTKRRGARSSQSLLIVLSGPSGVGKDAVLARMRKAGRPFHYVVTATTRPKRAREKNGVNYHFLSQKEFQQMIDKHQFLEWANVYGNYYGVPKDEITSALAKGLDTIVKVDVQGASTIKKILPRAVFIFLTPPSLEELEKRLRRRHSESSEDLALRLEKAEKEMKSLPLFDYVITSRQNKLDEVVSQIDSIIIAEKCRVKPRAVRL